MKFEAQAQIKSTLDFVDHLVASLHKCRDRGKQFFPDVVPYMNILPFPPNDASKAQKIVLRNHATKIWNTCNHLTTFDHPDTGKEVAKLRAFACLLLTSIAPNKTKSLANASNLFSITLIAGKACLREGLLDLAGRLLQTEATKSVLDMRMNESDDARNAPPSFLVEYYCLRALLEREHKRLDLTDYWYRRIGAPNFELQETDIQKVVDMCYEIGKDYLSQRNNEAMLGAVSWLERAMGLLDMECYQHIFLTSDLRLNLMHSFVRALARLTDSGSQKRAHQVLRQLKSEYGAKLPVILLSLEVACSEAGPGSDCETFGSQVEEVVRSVHLLDANHRLIMYYIQQLSHHSQVRASKCLKVYILHRLIPEDRSEWVEQAVINLVNMASLAQPADATSALQALEKDLTLFADTLKCELRSGIACAIHALIWKMVRETDTDNTRSLSMLWCQIGLHPILASAGEASNGKLERQLISYHLLVSNTGLAQQMLEQMSFTQKNNRSSRYLAYCVAVRSGNDVDAQSCLNTITNGQGENEQLLFACIGESIKHGRTLNTARLALRLLEKRLQDPSLSADLGDLLQYAAGMFLQVVAEQSPDQSADQEVPARLCSIFRHAVKLHVSHSTAGKNLLRSRINVSWFENNSFKLACDQIKIWSRRYTIDLLDCCRRFCEPHDGVFADVTQAEKSTIRLRECSFLQTVLYANEARNMSDAYTVEDLPESSYDSRSKPGTSECREVLHRNVFKLYTVLLKQWTESDALEKSSSEPFKSQLHVLTPLAFEALLFLNVYSCLSNGTSYDEISVHQFLQTINEIELPVASYAVLADTLLSMTVGTSIRDGLRVPRATAVNLLGKIIQALRQSPSYNIEQAARWLRCVAQLMFEDIETTLTDRETKRASMMAQQLEMLDSLIQQAMNLAKTAPSRSKQEANVKAQREMGGVVKSLHPYPEEEIHWLVTKVWNMAIDLHGMEQSEIAKQWAGKAVQMAEIGARGEGVMVGVVEQLKGNVKQLGWEI